MATQFKDYYELLGVPRTATPQEIKTAFRKLARQYHPDVNAQDPAKVEKFKEINEAHEVLGDPEKRRKYDQLGPQWREYEEWQASGAQGPDPFARYEYAAQPGTTPHYSTVSPDELEEMFGDRNPFSDFFQTFFAGGGGGARRGRQPQQRGQDVEGTAEITLDEAFRGTSRVMEISEGNQTRRISVNIPAGVHDGARVRAAGQGSRGSGGAGSGDLYIRVQVRPHGDVARRGDDLYLKAPVPLATALLGGTVTVSALGGRSIQLTVPPNTQNGAHLRLRGLGMPKLKGGGNGDLYAEVDVRLPLPLTDAGREAAERLRDAGS